MSTTDHVQLAYAVNAMDKTDLSEEVRDLLSNLASSVLVLSSELHHTQQVSEGRRKLGMMSIFLAESLGETDMMQALQEHNEEVEAPLREEIARLHRLIDNCTTPRQFSEEVMNMLTNSESVPAMFAVLKTYKGEESIAGFGVEFPDGSACLRWEDRAPTTILGESADALLSGVHAHGSLRIVPLYTDMGVLTDDELAKFWQNENPEGKSA